MTLEFTGIYQQMLNVIKLSWYKRKNFHIKFFCFTCILCEFFGAMMLQIEENIQPNGCVTSWLVTVQKME